MLAVDVHFTSPAGPIGRAVFLDAVRLVCRRENIRTGRVTYIVVDDRTIRAMNAKFLGHDHATDVITFPLEAEPLEGEIYISIETARRQAHELGVRVHEEVIRLAVHGLLHLCGYDDTTHNARERMFTVQEDCVRKVAAAHTARNPT